jgi:ABC-type polysaccharide/polyol phosphate transport system ATPase subunit
MTCAWCSTWLTASRSWPKAGCWPKARRRDRRERARSERLSGKKPKERDRGQRLNTFYGKSHILHDVSLVAEEGSITTLLGRNGAGKTR